MPRLSARVRALRALSHPLRLRIIEELRGSFSNVVGLPLHAAAALARKAGVVMEDEDASA